MKVSSFAKNKLRKNNRGGEIPHVFQDKIMILFIFVAMTLLQIKHLIVDWMWQPSYEFLNKGTYGHWGGIRHALKNAVGTGLVFVIASAATLSPLSILFIIAVDFIVHYHIDYAKVNINEYYGWKPTEHPQFWRLTGFDQFLHQVTYICLIGFSVVYFGM
jgi:hypothetical protein